uniref:LITAF domain-containing protein n=1 Tax=Knipowitschia caucasica TaxID=637954 RepID=A0AAV2LBX0_KNICA
MMLVRSEGLAQENVLNPLTGHVTLSPVIYNAENDGGVYTLPPLHFIPTAPPQLEEQDTPEPSPPSEEAVPPEPHIEVNLQEKDGMQIISAECLGQDGAFTMCPSCEQVVFTQTKKINGESVWIMSCIVAVVGLCFIAFCLDQLKSVRHKCPQCRSTIHTFHPF